MLMEKHISLKQSKIQSFQQNQYCSLGRFVFAEQKQFFCFAKQYSSFPYFSQLFCTYCTQQVTIYTFGMSKVCSGVIKCKPIKG